MTPEQLSKIWTVLSLFLLYYALNTYIATQGGNEIFDAKLVVSHRIPAAMMGIPICAIVLLLGSLVGIDYARRNGPSWHSRIPIVGFSSINTGSREGKIYQGVMLTVLSVLPAVSLIHFWILFSRAQLVTTKNPPKPIGSIWDWSALVSLDDPARICSQFHTEPQISCDGNITILPGLEPTIFAIITVLAYGATLVFWWWICCGSSRKPKKDTVR
jgi:hypothetical protein